LANRCLYKGARTWTGYDFGCLSVELTQLYSVWSARLSSNSTEVLHVFTLLTAGWFRFQIMTWEPDHDDRTRAQKPENQAGRARGGIKDA